MRTEIVIPNKMFPSFENEELHPRPLIIQQAIFMTTPL